MGNSQTAARLVGSPSKSYRVGEAFRASEVRMEVTEPSGRKRKVSGRDLQITANGVRVGEGYRFKERGAKNMTVRYGNSRVSYSLYVN